MSCAESKFSVQQSNANHEQSKDIPLNEESKTLSLSCKESEDSIFTAGIDSNDELTFSPTSNPTVSLHGRFCTQDFSVPSNSTVLFIIDFSISMDANDKLESGSCGRLKAARKIVDNFSTSNDVLFGIIPFSTTVISDHVVKPTGSFDFVNTKITTDKFCQHIGGTNIQDPLITAKSEVDNERLTYIVLITDGEPTRYNETTVETENSYGSLSNPLKYAIQAAEDLRRLNNVVFYSLFLDVDNDSKSFEKLVKITGDRSKIFKAENADQLEILAETNVIPVNISTNNIKSTLIIDNKSVPLKIESFEQDIDNSWIFKTVPFELIGFGKETVPHLIKTTFKNTKGETLESEVKINFKKLE